MPSARARRFLTRHTSCRRRHCDALGASSARRSRARTTRSCGCSRWCLLATTVMTTRWHTRVVGRSVGLSGLFFFATHHSDAPPVIMRTPRLVRRFFLFVFFLFLFRGAPHTVERGRCMAHLTEVSGWGRNRGGRPDVTQSLDREPRVVGPDVTHSPPPWWSFFLRITQRVQVTRRIANVSAKNGHHD